MAAGASTSIAAASPSLPSSAGSAAGAAAACLALLLPAPGCFELLGAALLAACLACPPVLAFLVVPAAGAASDDSRLLGTPACRCCCFQQNISGQGLRPARNEKMSVNSFEADWAACCKEQAGIQAQGAQSTLLHSQTHDQVLLELHCAHVWPQAPQHPPQPPRHSLSQRARRGGAVASWAAAIRCPSCRAPLRLALALRRWRRARNRRLSRQAPALTECVTALAHTWPVCLRGTSEWEQSREALAVRACMALCRRSLPCTCLVA